MNGIHATNPSVISHDPRSLEDQGFWAVQIDYEGRWMLVRFEDVVNEDFPNAVWNAEKSAWKSSLDRDGYISYVATAREAIAAGDFYQVNACRVLSRKSTADLRGLFSRILEMNPAPYACYFSSEEVEIASASPELFLSFESRGDEIVLTSSPIKGTSKSREFGEKDQSENVMIVDLIRNDLSRISTEGSVDVSRLLGIEEHPGLFHLVSDVVGVLKPDFSWGEFADAMLPAGSISGAPKSSATAFIAKNEIARGPYCGVLGYIDTRSGKLKGVLSVAIRIFWREEDELKFGTGAGITWGSDPAGEWEETELKASRLMRIADGEELV